MSNRKTEITEAQQDAVEAMHRACKAKNGHPSIADIARELGVSRTSIYRLLQEAEKKGFITQPKTNVVGSYGLTAAGEKLLGVPPAKKTGALTKAAKRPRSK